MSDSTQRRAELEMTEGRPAVLIVDDDKGIRESLELLLCATGYTVRLAEDGVSALSTLGACLPDVVLSDLDMPRMGGDTLLSLIRLHFPTIRTIAMSGSFVSGETPSGVVADAFFAKGADSLERLFEILAKIHCPPLP